MLLGAPELSWIIWGQLSGGLPAAVGSEPWMPNHFEAGFLQTEAQARELLSQGHPLSPPAYYIACVLHI